MRSKNIILMFFCALIAFTLMAGSAFALGVGSNVSQDAPGQALVFGYYDTRPVADGGPGLTDNYMTVTNTSEYYNQAHVRVRTGERSIELLDFDIILTPWDVFAYDLYQLNNHIVFASCDTHTLQQSGFSLNYDSDGDLVNDCVIYTSDPVSPFYFAGLTSLITHCTGDTGAAAVAQTFKGYAEVIKEGNFNLGPAPCNVVPNGTTLWDWTQMGCSVFNAYPPDLVGKIYYADTQGLWPASIAKLGDVNAYAISWFTDGNVILHKNTYLAELASPTGPGYSYDDPGAAPSGASDINLCFYDATAGNINRVGAAASYGPTLADIDYDQGTAGIGRQDVGFPVPWQRTVAQVDSLTYDIFNGVNNGAVICTLAGLTTPCYAHGSSLTYSHYFNFAPLMSASYVTTFPAMHFIDQQIEVTENLVFDTEENDCYVAPGKFISPGLPGDPSVAQEVNIYKPDTCSSFAEGWRSFIIEVVNDGPGSTLAFFDYYLDGVADDRLPFGFPYSPSSIIYTMTDGDDVFTTSPSVKEPAAVLPIDWQDN